MEMIKRPLINILTQKKVLNIYLYTIHVLFVLCGSFQLIVVGDDGIDEKTLNKHSHTEKKI